MQTPKKVPRVGLAPWAMGTLILGLVFLCYWPALRGGIVWDDPAHITKPELRSAAGLARIWSDLHATQQYYPVLHSAFWIEHRFWGDATLGYHLTNVMLHATACMLLVLVLRRLWEPAPDLGRQRTVPAGAEWLGGLLLAVHPVGVESVAWISEQKNVLSLVFYLSAAYVYLDFDRTRRVRTFGFASAFFLLALGTKTVTATLPAALLVVLWWKHGIVRWRRDVLPLLPWFMAAGLAGTTTAWVERVLIGAKGANYDLSFGERLLLAGRVIWFYLGKLVWPADLMFIYPRWEVHAAAPHWLVWLVAAAGVTVALWLIRQRTRGPLAAWLFFVGSLFPALGFFNVYPFVYSYVADHFQYLASLGIIVLAAVGLARWLAATTRPLRTAARVLGAAVVGVLAWLSHQQSRHYRDGVTLYRATLEKNPACWMAHNNLAMELEHDPEQLPDALAHFAEALRLDPGNADIRNNLGNRLLQLGRETEAIAHFKEALRHDPTHLLARLNLANTLAKDPGHLLAAMDLYAETLRQYPENAEAHFSLAVTLATIEGRAADALAEIETTLRLQPDHPRAQAEKAELLARQPGRTDETQSAYEAALRLAPEIAKTHYNYAVWLETQPGQMAEAIRHYEEALRLDPDYAWAHNNLGIIFARKGEFGPARAHWEAVLRTKPNDEDAINNLRLLDARTRH